MDAVLRLGGVLLLAGGVAAEAGQVIPATGLALVLGACLGAYLWFLAIARRQMEPPQGRRR
jgi:membrane protein DedA with SNARE-associated domain